MTYVRQGVDNKEEENDNDDITCRFIWPAVRHREVAHPRLVSIPVPGKDAFIHVVFSRPPGCIYVELPPCVGVELTFAALENRYLEVIPQRNWISVYVPGVPFDDLSAFHPNFDPGWITNNADVYWTRIGVDGWPIITPQRSSERTPARCRLVQLSSSAVSSAIM